MIKPEFKSLSDVLANRVFRIPGDQMYYYADDDKRKPVFDALKKLRQVRTWQPDSTRYIAAIIAYETGETVKAGATTFPVYDLVDGQQTLTTLIILLKSIAKKLASLDMKKEAGELNALLAKDGGVFILQNDHDPKNFLKNYLETGNVPPKSEVTTHVDVALLFAFGACEKFVQHWGNNLAELLQLVKNGLYFMFHCAKDRAAVYASYEVFSIFQFEAGALQKTRNLLMNLLYECANEAGNVKLFYESDSENIWKEIYRLIAKNHLDGDSIIMFSVKQKTNDRQIKFVPDAIKYFKQYCESGEDTEEKIERIEEVINLFCKIVRQLSELS